jgi:hypothetical protein
MVVEHTAIRIQLGAQRGEVVEARVEPAQLGGPREWILPQCGRPPYFQKIGSMASKYGR